MICGLMFFAPIMTPHAVKNRASTDIKLTQITFFAFCLHNEKIAETM